MKSPAARPGRFPRFFGIHLDLHAHNHDRELGKEVTEGLVERLLDAAQPDYLQYDCKGHGGFLAYPKSAVSETAGGPGGAGIVQDALAIYRRVTARRGVGLYMHFSGVWDDVALRDHPAWATLDPDGKPRPNATSTFSPYVRERMIPQMLEVLARYRPDGFWVDGDCWAVHKDYQPEACRRFRERTGLASPPRNPGEPGWWEWMAIHREQFLAYVKTYADAMHAASPATAVASNWLHSRFSPFPACVAPVDFISGDFSATNSVETARFDARQMVGVGLPWDLMAWGFTTVPGAGKTLKSAPQLCQEAAQVLAQGGGFQIYYNPDRDGDIPEHALAVIADTSRFCRERQALCTGSVTASQVAILLDTTSLWSKSDAVLNSFGGEYREMQGVLQACLDAGHSADMITDHQLAARAVEYAAIVVPEWEHLADSTMETLVAYARAGGALLITGARAAARFADVLGVALPGPAEKAGATLHRPELSATTAGADGLWQPVTPLAGTRVVATRTVKQVAVRDPQPAATVAACGKGRAAAVYGPLGASYFANHAPALRDLAGALLDALYMPQVILLPGDYGRVELVLRRQDEDLVIHLLNLNGAAMSDCSLTPDGNAVASGGNTPFVDRIPAVGPIVLRVRGADDLMHATFEPGGLPLAVRRTPDGHDVEVPRLGVHGMIRMSAVS